MMDAFTGLSLEGRTALVTGSSKNLGRATAELLAARGARVVVHASAPSAELSAVAEGIVAAGGEAIALSAELGSDQGVAELVSGVASTYGSIDILVNNAAIRPRRLLEELELHEWRRVMSVNLEAAFLLSRAFVPGMADRGWGRVVNVAGADAFWGKPTKPHVVSANLGKIGLMRSIAVRYGPRGVTANAVVPGAMATTRTHSLHNYPDLRTGFRRLLARVPAGRAGEPWELAEVVAFLAAPAAGYVSGQTLHVSGGAFPTTADAMAEPAVDDAAVEAFIGAALDGS